jgi:para-nitrobenzyl esterase
MGPSATSTRMVGAFMAILLAGMASAAAPQVTVTGGTIAGVPQAGGGTIFRGIPFAAPPTGPLRWQPPQPVPPWQGVRMADKPAPGCLQNPLGWNDKIAASSAEDCLYLDINTPEMTPAEPLPVLVVIHGGANRAGSAAGYVESGITRHGLVLVALQYRLDALGFLSLPALAAESPVHASGNYGLMDQIAALRWVRENIARFGGDPNNITIAGQSAGAQDVSLLLLSPAARGLFHKAIAQSGTAGFGVPPRSRTENEALGEDLLGLTGLPGGAAGLAALRALPADRLMEAAGKLTPKAIDDASFIWLQAVVDGAIINEAPLTSLTEGTQAPVPLLLGANAQELPLHGGPQAVGRVLERAFGANAVQARAFYMMKGVRLPSADPRLGDVSMQLANDLTFRCPARFMAARQVAIGQPVWHYEFDLLPPGAKGPVSHSSELPFVFNGLPAGNADVTLSAYWANFIRSGNPNGKGLPAWPAYGPTHQSIRFESTGPRTVTNLRADLCDLLPQP